MLVVVDAGPLVAAIDRSERSHALAVAVIRELAETLVVPDVVVLEVDQLARGRAGAEAARAFLDGVADDEPRRVPMDGRLFERAVAYDTRFGALNLGLADATVMALAERERAPILTFDFAHFRATRPLRGGFWRLVVDEQTFRARI